MNWYIGHKRRDFLFRNFAVNSVLPGNDFVLSKLEPEECFQTYTTQENNFTPPDSGNYNLSRDGEA